jgi:hypothetical protein
LQIQENILLHHQNSNFKKIQEKRAGNNHLPETEYQREREREMGRGKGGGGGGGEVIETRKKSLSDREI